MAQRVTNGGHESSGSTQTNDTNLLFSSNDLSVTSASSTNQTTTNGQSGGTSWQGEWNRLASHVTPGKQADTNVEVINALFLRKGNITNYRQPASPVLLHSQISNHNFIG